MSFVYQLTRCRSILVDYLRRLTNTKNREKVGLVYFYFDNHDPNDQTAEDFVRSLLKQLLYHERLPLPKNVSSLYDTVIKKGKSAEPDRDKLMNVLCDCIKAFDKVFVLVDAFDECGDEIKPLIMSDLRKLPQTQLRLFLTGRNGVFDSRSLRDDDDLPAWLNQASFIQMSASDEDIQLYLAAQLKKKGKDIDQDLKDQITAKICSQAAGQ